MAIALKNQALVSIEGAIIHGKSVFKNWPFYNRCFLIHPFPKIIIIFIFIENQFCTLGNYVTQNISETLVTSLHCFTCFVSYFDLHQYFLLTERPLTQLNLRLLSTFRGVFRKITLIRVVFKKNQGNYIPDSASYGGCVCWSSTLHREVFLRVLRFSLSSKTKI